MVACPTRSRLLTTQLARKARKPSIRAMAYPATLVGSPYRGTARRSGQLDATYPDLTIEWRHDGYRVVRVFVQDPLDAPTRERLMAKVVTFRDAPDLASLRAEVRAIAQDTNLIATFVDQADHSSPYGDWVTVGFRRRQVP